MKLSWWTNTLHLKRPFRIARGVRDVVHTVTVALSHEGVIGYGEASPSARYGESVEGTERFIETLDLSRFESPFLMEDILAYVDLHGAGNHAAKCAIDIALHDWVGKSTNRPTHQLFGLSPEKAAPCSYTIGIGTEDEIKEKIREAAEFPIFKVKLGTDDDITTMEIIRKLTDKKICVDANEGWSTRALAEERLRWIEGFDVEFVEQPMPAGSHDDIRWLRDRTSLPLIADEDICRLEEIDKVLDVYDGINIKIMKCTGLREAMRMISVARARKRKVMLGCMIESSIGISAAAQLTPLVDYSDLDGNILIKNDPWEGVRNEGGKLRLNALPGIGVQPLESGVAV